MTKIFTEETEVENCGSCRKKECGVARMDHIPNECPLPDKPEPPNPLEERVRVLKGRIDAIEERLDEATSFLCI